MKSKKLTETSFLLRIEKDESIIKSILSFIREKNIEGGYFYGIGACSHVELAHYTVHTKQYKSIVINKPLEITNLTGTIGVFEKTPLIHAHITCADTEMRAFGGHLVEGVISGTAEIIFILVSPLTKEYDQITGLKLFSI